MVFKFRVAFLVLITFTFILVSNSLVIADNNIDMITAKAYVLMDADSGKTLQAKNEHMKLSPASLTKLMTLLLALEAIKSGKVNKNDQVVSSQHAYEMDGTQLHLKPGEVMNLENMLMGMALNSANDASVAVAEHLAGSEEKFVVQMNQRARSLGMKDTNFKNASGLPAKGHYSSAYDMAVLARYAITHSDITNYTSIKQYQLYNRKLKNSNKLLWQYPGADGLKTGYTTEAQHCLTATAKRDNLRLITAVMFCPQPDGHFKDSIELLNYGFNRYSCKSLLAKGYVCGTAKVLGGVTDKIEAITNTKVTSIYVKGQGNKLRSEVKLKARIKAPVKKGQKLGEILVYNDQELIKRVDAVAARDIVRSSSIDPGGYVLIILLLLAAAYYFYIRLNKKI
jgi:D-alanyl-D-alanine carboxypeptidase (penicillin-binding protein 5/6)